MLAAEIKFLDSSTDIFAYCSSQTWETMQLFWMFKVGNIKLMHILAQIKDPGASVIDMHVFLLQEQEQAYNISHKPFLLQR